MMSSRAMKQVWDSPWKGRSAMWAVHVAVADTVNEQYDYQFWMAQTTLAVKAGVSLRTVTGWMREAVSAGVLVMLEDNSKEGRPNRYQFVLDPEFDSNDEGAQSTPRGQQPALKGQQSLPKGQQPLLTELELNKKKNNKEVNLFDEEVDENATESDSSSLSPARKIFETWVEATGKDPNKTKLNGKRRGKITARLNEGYSVDDLCAAVRGIALSAWHTGDNPSGKRYDDLTVALRDGGQVEKFRDLDEQGHDDRRRSAVDTVLEMFSNRGQSGRALSRALTEGSE